LGDLIKIATQNSHKKYVDDPMFLACFIEIGSVDFLTYFPQKRGKNKQ
jgi:hypothetical protein